MFAVDACIPGEMTLLCPTGRSRIVGGDFSSNGDTRYGKAGRGRLIGCGSDELCFDIVHAGRGVAAGIVSGG